MTKHIERQQTEDQMPKKVAERMCGNKWITCGKPYCACTGACEASMSNEPLDFDEVDA